MKNKEAKNVGVLDAGVPLASLWTQSELIRRLFDISISRASQGRSNTPFSEEEIERLRSTPGVVATSGKKDTEI